ncbi:MAG: hypothetical protein WD208_11400 [Dehalococcoidia bacterium]
MTQQNNVGSVELLAAAVKANPQSPDLSAYFETLSLGERERALVEESMKSLSDAVARPVDSPVPTIVNDTW